MKKINEKVNKDNLQKTVKKYQPKLSIVVFLAHSFGLIPNINGSPKKKVYTFI